jgi:hypothetical protein
MGKPIRWYVAKAEAGLGWRIWNKRLQRWWGERYVAYPQELVDELNAGKRPERLAELIKESASKRVSKK